MASPVMSFAELLRSAVTEPGIISQAYRQFHQYSFGNQLLAWSQCQQRGLPPGPIASYSKWQELGRQVRKGERALTLCMPVTIPSETEFEPPIVRFVYRRNWFVLAQTDGTAVPEISMPRWDSSCALLVLDIRETPFEGTDGNCMGYARDRVIAINPVNPLPHKTRFHEVAHVLLGHTAERVHSDGPQTPRDVREVEAECVALLCCAALDLPGVEYARGYIQHWWASGEPIPDRSAQRVLKVTDQILKAGQPWSARGGA